MEILFINCCMKEKGISRTERLCREFLSTYRQNNPNDQITELVLRKEELSPFNEDMVNLRFELIEKEDWAHPMFTYAKQLKQADKVLIGAPYWDLSFPALLKIYIENIFVTNLTFGYTQDGAVGLCNAEKMMYITTMGGPKPDIGYGEEYISRCSKMLGIPQFDSVCSENLDVWGMDVEQILNDAKDKVKKIAVHW